MMATTPQPTAAPDAQQKKRDFRQEVTDNIVKLLESNLAPWQKPWDPTSAPGSMPLNPTTGKAYRGGNAVHLMAVGLQRGYADPRWMTYKQAGENGWQVRKGEKGSQIEFWEVKEPKPDKVNEPAANPVPRDQNNRDRPTLIHRVYTVINAQQIDGVPPDQPKSVSTFEAVRAGEQILAKSDTKIYHDQSDRAYYSRSEDTIHLPLKEAFKDAAGYYGTALHEVAHASGHPSRLNRSTLNESYRFGDTNYAKEELRAELASLFIAAETGIPHDPKSHAAYVGSWIQALKEDKNEIFRAAHDASAAADYILGPHRSQQLQAAPAVRETTELVARAEPSAGTTAVHQKRTGDERRTTNEERPVTEQVRDGQTASGNAVPLNEASAVAVQALGNGVRTFSAQTESGVYRGTVVGDTQEHVVQRVSSRSAVAHRKADLDTTPMAGQNVSIAYLNARGSVRELRERAKAPERAR
jgi:antirestriction protein ArdC